ncbi:rhodanese-related sulfurtransferase [Candidatus Phytoplasma meliae]|uniref:tRNA uridine(34) hydroxylase n=1 Tax=Candidatus Phytoplasma meliae TaxID=1848402 RepID=A0ABS5CXP3_9MOLU|nr:rhodanese-related sulfurtransferase [Candidatus Phytoplasma meliae]MBP5835741.1 rhodanese-related sulfurtransferase [Candidatus Phytoplasma meliae]
MTNNTITNYVQKLTPKDQYQAILYYHYTKLQDIVSFHKQHFQYCQKLGLLGRIILSEEGINGTLSGIVKNIQTYMNDLKKDSRFSDIVFKISSINAHIFPRLSVKVKKELVNLNLKEDINILKNRGKYLKPQAFYQAMQEENVLILDARNYYEYDLGHFRNAYNPKIKNFRDLPTWVEQNTKLLQNKKILTYCTGGVRCEKFSSFLEKKGFNEVYQLEGGIISYSQNPQTQGALWNGQMYVFDQRIALPVNQKEHIIVGKDYFDQTPCERYINCSNPQCNKQILCHESNEHKYLGACCQKCRLHPKNRYLLKQQNQSLSKNKMSIS